MFGIRLIHWGEQYLKQPDDALAGYKKSRLKVSLKRADFGIEHWTVNNTFSFRKFISDYFGVVWKKFTLGVDISSGVIQSCAHKSNTKTILSPCKETFKRFHSSRKIVKGIGKKFFANLLYSVNNKTSEKNDKQMMVIPENLKVRPPREEKQANKQERIRHSCEVRASWRWN